MSTDLTIIETTAPATLDPTILAGQCGESTIAMYARDAHAYTTFCAAYDLAPDQAPSLARWRAHLAQDTTMSPRTINRMLSAVKRIMREAASQGYTDHERSEAFRQVTGVKVAALKDRQRAGNRTRITPADMRRLIESPDRSTNVGRRDYALLSFLAGTGCRCEEAATLTIGQVIKQGKSYRVSVMGKNETEPSIIALSSEAYHAIMGWIDARPVASQFVFTSAAGRGDRFTAEPLSSVSVWRIVQKHAAAVGMAHIKPHDFRRFVGTMLAMRDGVPVAQKQLRHKHARTTLDNYVLSDVPEGATDGLY